MTKEAIIDVLGGLRGGAFTTVYTDRPAKVRKSYSGPEIRKIGAMQFHAKAVYANTKVVKEAVAEGTREAPERQPWVEEVEVVNGVEFWRKGTQWYLTVLPVRPLPSTWTLGGVEVPKDDIRDYLLAEDAKDTDYSAEKEAKAEVGQAMFNIFKLENVVSFS